MVKAIYLTSGHVTIVEDEDYEFLSNHTWHLNTSGYATTNIKTEKGYTLSPMHRLITNAGKGDIVDHINRDRLDNRRSNLRFCDRKLNAWNRGKKSDGLTSRYKGVYLVASTGKYESTIYVSGKAIYLGSYVVEEDAAYYYNQAATEHYKEFAFLNELPPGYIPTEKFSAGKRSIQTSKYRGVNYDKNLGKYQVRIQKDGKRVCVGYFSTERIAAEMYNVFALELHGDKAILNTFDQMEGIIDG